MKLRQSVGIFLAILFHAGILLFGGLLLFGHGKAKGPASEEVEIVAPTDDSKKQELEPEKPSAEQKDETSKEAPPELNEQALALDLSQIEMALNPGEAGGGDFVKRVGAMGAAAAHATGETGGRANEEVFSVADLDQAPRAVFQPAPEYPSELKRKKLSGSVYVLFMVDKSGHVVSPIVHKSNNPAFDVAAMQAVKRWRFEPGKRSGQSVQFKMRVPITFANG